MEQTQTTQGQPSGKCVQTGHANVTKVEVVFPVALCELTAPECTSNQADTPILQVITLCSVIGKSHCSKPVLPSDAVVHVSKTFNYSPNWCVWLQPNIGTSHSDDLSEANSLYI